MSRIGSTVIHFPSVDTTMRVAHECARDGCAEGTIVTADLQTAGRGRLGRTWISEPGLGLYLSVVLRPKCRPDAAPILTLVAGLAVKEALEEVTDLSCDIRWPNDILIRERKCCGILVEMETNRSRVDYVVVGIGINLNHMEFPPELRTTATSLRMETGRQWTSESVLQPLLRSLEACYELHRTVGAAPILEAFQRASSYATGRRVVIEGLPPESSGPNRGVTAGLNSRGMLLLRAEDGSVVPIVAGSVRPDPVTM